MKKNEVFCWPEPALLLILLFDLNILFWARKVIGTLDKRALGPLSKDARRNLLEK